MKTWVLAAMVAALGVGVGTPLVVRAGFDMDPALQASMKPAASLKLASIAGAPAATGPLPAAMSQSVQSSVSSPSAAWNETIDGFAKNQPPEKVLRELVPAGGKLIANTAWPTDKKVSWEGSNPRMVIAKKILSDAGLNGTFDGTNLIVGTAPPVPAALPTQVAMTAPTARAATAVQQPEPEAAPASRLWTMPKGVMLSDGLQDWMEQTAAQGDRYRWTLEWDAYEGPSKDQRVDYKIVAPLRFTGQVDEAVAQLIVLYRKSPKPLAVEISRQQRHIHVKLRGAN